MSFDFEEAVQMTANTDDWNGLENAEPGRPFYDDTLNYLDTQVRKINAELGKLSDRREKVQDQMEAKKYELDLTLEILHTEWQQRRPADPETGEMITLNVPMS